MHHALFDKDVGYYRKKNPIGKNADFITAPQISQIFGEMLAAYLLQIFSHKKESLILAEMGAGHGTLFYDILFTIRKLAKNKNALALDFLALAEFHIIEINEVLIEVQKKKLAEFPISWHKNFTDLPKNKKLFFITNELFDCFAIDQYVKTDIGWCERMVEENNGKFNFVLSEFSLEQNQFIEKIIGFENAYRAPFGAVFEHSTDARDFMTQLCQALKTQDGVSINFDYGYVENEFANSLQALKNHQKTNVLENIGESDITALVDFSSLQKIATNFNLNSSLISQREFLLSLGIEERKKILLKNKTIEQQNEINLAVDRLLSIDKMGELFKCLIVWK